MKRAFLIFVLVLAVAIPAMAADTDLAKKSTLQSILKAGKLRVGMEPGYMPFEMQDKQSRIVGFDVDMAKIMAKEMGVELELVPTAWDGIIGSLLTDKFDIIMSGMTVTQQRNMKVNFVDPYIIVGQTILINAKVAGAVTSYKDLNDPKYTVTSKLGTTGEQAVKGLIPRAKYKSFETEPEAALEVMNGKADAFHQREDVAPSTLAIASETIVNLFRITIQAGLYRIYVLAHRYGIDFNLAQIPAEYPHNADPVDFEPEVMRPLFDLGFKLASEGYEWSKVPHRLDADEVYAE